MKSDYILVVDDQELVRTAIARTLENAAFQVKTAADGAAALAMIETALPRLILLDVGLPGMDGRAVCQRIRDTYKNVFLPIILISGRDTVDQLVAGLASGANDFIGKPFRPEQLIAKIRSFLGVKDLYDEDRVRIDQLKQFFSPEVADLVASSTQFESCRKEITAVFFDLRGFTSFVEKFPPDEVMAVLNEYYRVAGTEVLRHQGTIGSFAGDGMMAFFNDPVELPNHVESAVTCALSIRRELGKAKQAWNNLGYNLDLGAGIATGMATIGVVGFERFRNYAAIGAVCNLASRLCSKAQGNQVLSSAKCLSPILSRLKLEGVGRLELKGIHVPIEGFNIVGFNE